MTRINLLPVEELSDQHLIAEYRELPRCIKQKVNISDAPDTYCLGKGHVKWAKKHIQFLIYRYHEICNELRYRNFKVNYSWINLTRYTLKHYDKKLIKNYIPTEEDINLSRERIINKINRKPNWYKWTGRSKPNYIK